MNWLQDFTKFWLIFCEKRKNVPRHFRVPSSWINATGENPFAEKSSRQLRRELILFYLMTFTYLELPVI